MSFLIVVEQNKIYSNFLKSCSFILPLKFLAMLLSYL